jgi:glutathione S-transferase
MADQQVILGYWGAVGLGQSLRYLLNYVEANWKDEVYSDHAKWFGADKQGLGIPLPNLPYLIDGEFKLSESNALLRYIPRRFGKPELLGKTIEDQARIDQLLGVLGDIQTAVMGSLKE